jgi:hydrogenase-1 operon protein HyaF
MLNNELMVTSSVKAILVEISEALQHFIENGQTWTIFTNKMSLTAEERQEIREFFGLGNVTIKLTGSDEPAEWLESGTAGVWYGVFYDQSNNPILETIEIGTFPQVPGAQMEDVKGNLEVLKARLGI